MSRWGEHDPTLRPQGVRQITRSKWGIEDVFIFGLPMLTFVGAFFSIIGLTYKALVMKRPDRYERSDMDLAYTKLNEVLGSGYVAVQIDSPFPERMVQFDIEPAIRQFGTPIQGLMHVATSEHPLYTEVTSAAQAQETEALALLVRFYDERHRQSQHLRSIFNPREVATLWHLPHEGMHAPTIRWVKGKHVHAPRAVRAGEGGVCLGVNRYGGVEHPVYWAESERTQHLAIIGRTGTGKTSLLHNLIAQDIAAGRGVAVIDPTGRLVRAILQTAIGAARKDDVVILDIANQIETGGVLTHYPPPLNLLAKPDGVEEDIAAGQMMSVFERLYGAGFGVTQMGNTLSMALLTLSQEPKPTLLDIERVFEDLSYREALLARLDNIVVSRFWERFDAKRGGDQLLFPVLRRLDTFYSNKRLYPITCHPDPLPLAQILRENKILLVSLQADRAKVPEAERMVLGAIVTAQLQMAAMAEAITTPPYLLYVDEVQNFVTTALDETLRAARQFGLGLIVATQ